jgi:hypothetical protein
VATCEVQRGAGDQIPLGLARTIYIRCIHGIFGREITEYTVIYGAYIRFWPTLNIIRGLSQGPVRHISTKPWYYTLASIKKLQPLYESTLNGASHLSHAWISAQEVLHLDQGSAIHLKQKRGLPQPRLDIYAGDLYLKSGL